MKKISVMLAAGAMIFMLSSCGQAENTEDMQTGTADGSAEISQDAGEADSDGKKGADETALQEDKDIVYGELERLAGEYEYTSDNGTGKLTIQKTSDGYDISDYESESSYRFLADSSNVEIIKDNRIYIKYPEQVSSDDTVQFSYYILEYDTDGIEVYYGKTAFEEAQLLYRAVKQSGQDTEQGGANRSESGDAGGESDPAGRENNGIELDDDLEIDFFRDYSEDIRADVDHVVSASASLQEELKNMENIIQKYTPLAEAAQTQGEMNISSEWFLVIWDTELNSLWNRFSNSADQQTKEKVLAEQRNWIDMKEGAVLTSIGYSEENGSMYPLLVNSYLEEITKNRAYVIANELAKITGESFVMPERSAKYGLFVENYGTGSIYSDLITRPGYSGDDEAIIGIHRMGQVEGTFVDSGNGELAFTADDGSVKGIIKINGWDGASFTVTESSREISFPAGEEFQFPFAF